MDDGGWALNNNNVEQVTAAFNWASSSQTCEYAYATLFFPSITTGLVLCNVGTPCLQGPWLASWVQDPSREHPPIVHETIPELAADLFTDVQEEELEYPARKAHSGLFATDTERSEPQNAHILQ